MRLLVITQIVDRTDRELGFFHEWLRALAETCEQLTVIGLKVGDYALPENVRVLSLGKEVKPSRLRYVLRFFRYLVRYRASYDSVFIHQNQEYAILGGFLWKVWGKRVALWRNHYAGSWVTGLAVAWCTKVFCTSAYSYTARYKKTVFMPVGIPDRLFYPHDDIERIPHSILSLGRVAPSKKIEQLIEALVALHARNVAFHATIVGNVLPEYRSYLEGLKRAVHEGGIEELVSFVPGVSYVETPELYAAHDVFVNMSKSGMFDKTMFEAMLCETLVVTCNKDLKGEIRDQFLFEEDDPQQLADRLEALLTLSHDERVRAGAGLRVYAAREHSLSQLVERLQEELM